VTIAHIVKETGLTRQTVYRSKGDAAVAWLLGDYEYPFTCSATNLSGKKWVSFLS
jgi:hypothetical protein